MLLTALRIPSRLVIGVARAESAGSASSQDPRLTAHAWVEHDGRVILGGVHAIGLEPLPNTVP
jgi:hypothetical protein